MATQNLGALGNTSGKLAHLVYFKKNDGGFVRLAQQKKAAQTVAQLETTTKFALMQSFLGKLSGFISKGFESKDLNVSAYNEAFRVNLKMAITGSMPDYTINYDSVQLTHGSLNKPGNLNSSSIGTTINLSWFYNATATNELGTDQLSVVVYNPAKDLVLQYDRLGVRSEGNVAIELPPDFSGDEVLTWTCFQSEIGFQVSNSSFVRVSIS